MSVYKGLNNNLAMLGAILLINSGNVAAENNDIYSSSANVAIDWNINQQSINTGQGIVLKVPQTLFQMSFLMSKIYSDSQQPMICYNLNNAVKYSFHLNSLPNILTNASKNLFIKWSGLKSDVNASFTPVKDNNITTEKSPSCMNISLDKNTYLINQADIAKNGKPLANVHSLQIDNSFQVNGDEVNVNLDITAQDVYVIDLNKHYGKSNLSIRFQNLNVETVKDVLNRDFKYDSIDSSNSELLFLIEKLPTLVNEDSKVTWHFDGYSVSGHTEINGNVDLTALMNNYLKLSTIGNLTLNMLAGANEHDLISMMIPSADAFKGEVSMQIPTEEMQDLMNLALKSSHSFKNDNEKTIILKQASQLDISDITNSLLTLAQNYKLITSSDNTVRFEYKFQNGKLQNPMVKLSASNPK